MASWDFVCENCHSPCAVATKEEVVTSVFICPLCRGRLKVVAYDQENSLSIRERIRYLEGVIDSIAERLADIEGMI